MIIYVNPKNQSLDPPPMKGFGFVFLIFWQGFAWDLQNHWCDLRSKGWFLGLHPRKRRWTWKNNQLKMYLLFKISPIQNISCQAVVSWSCPPQQWQENATAFFFPGRSGGYQPPPETQTFESFDLGSGRPWAKPKWPSFSGSLCLAGGFKHFIIFIPIWGRFPFWLIFFRWVETTNQMCN